MEATVVEDCRGVLQVYSNGTITRSQKPSFVAPFEDDGRVLSKDVVFEPSLGLELRLYIPALVVTTKLPIFVYFHGGGFCIGSRTWPNFHNYCLRLAASLNAIVVAPDYRLGPEHRLPDALDDGFWALRWIRAQAAAAGSSAAEPWLADHADFARVYVSGDSAGGSIAHHVSVRAQSEDWGQMKIKGYVHLMAFYGGEDRKPSEAMCPTDARLNLELNDRFWRLSLPVGANRDHPICNPLAPGAPCLSNVALPPVLVVAGGRDLLRDREIEYAEVLKSSGKEVELAVFEEEEHGFFTLTPNSPASGRLMERIIQFMKAHP
uniref:Alpha/beta hydrolase fold-3 domain-containing protein n=1 Tax=Picea sitchensis TaxID=3332 RepID=A9NQD3_PICSI|nr:unknown [Picea sitchensis]